MAKRDILKNRITTLSPQTRKQCKCQDTCYFSSATALKNLLVGVAPQTRHFWTKCPEVRRVAPIGCVMWLSPHFLKVQGRGGHRPPHPPVKNMIAIAGPFVEAARVVYSAQLSPKSLYRKPTRRRSCHQRQPG